MLGRIAIFVVAFVLGGVAVWAFRPADKSATSANPAADSAAPAPAGKQRKILYYQDAMYNPPYISVKPGFSPMGMKLEPVYEDDKSAGSGVKIDPTIVQNMGIRTAPVTRGSLTTTVRAVGILEVPEPGTYEVNLKINGWVQKLYADSEGMHVHKGEPLFDLFSPDLQVAEEELIGATKALSALDPNATDTVRAESQTMVDSSRQKLRLWGIDDQDIDAIAKSAKAPQTIPFRSPVDGHVEDKMIVEGSAIQAGTKLMRIEDHTSLWLEIQVYEEQIPLVAIGQTVDATVDSVPGRIFSGPITFIYPHLDHMARTEKVRVVLDNAKHELRPGMYATANIRTTPITDALIVPREAVIDTGTKQMAFVAESDGHFEPRDVRMGIIGDGDQVQILEGLAPGENVVTSGQFLMDVESRTNEATEKFLNNSAALVVAHCEMKNADWIQRGETISNPYLGLSMSTCGSVTRKLTATDQATPIDAVKDNYMLVVKALAADKLDAGSIQQLKASADNLPDQYANLRKSIAALALATDLDAARSAFAPVSTELIRAIGGPK
jgi:RND family efflux transporter MFP subunit